MVGFAMDGGYPRDPEPSVKVPSFYKVRGWRVRLARFWKNETQMDRFPVSHYASVICKMQRGANDTNRMIVLMHSFPNRF